MKFLDKISRNSTLVVQIPLERQCELLGLARSTYYYQPRPPSEFNLVLMRLIDEQYTKTPFYGVPRITVWLNKKGYPVNHKRVARLMRLMGLQAIYPKRKTSIPSKEHKIHPYLLIGITVERPDQVWCADITYIRMLRGFIYLVAVMDWFSRYVLAWEVSVTMEKDFCLSALDRALIFSNPEIFNTDQGSQFTSTDFTGRLERKGIAISMDGRGRVFDNIFIERLWRTVKYEEVYLHDYQNVREAREGLSQYLSFYNTERFHSSLGNHTPEEVYAQRRTAF
jgi:putative transposase